MKVFIYSEARQDLAKLLVIAQKAEVEIRRRDGTTFSLISKKRHLHPLISRVSIPLFPRYSMGILCSFRGYQLAYTSILSFSLHYTERVRRLELRKQELVMLLDDLRVKKDAIAALGRQYGARHIRVFGSVARREERPDSDIDFLVEFPRGYDLFSQRLPLAEQLARLLKRHVDLVPEHELNRHICEQVLSEAVEL